MLKKEIFHSPTKGQMKLDGVIKEISDFITAILAYRIGKGGRYFWKKTNGHKTYQILRDRIYQEVTISLETAQDVLGYLSKSNQFKNISDFDLQIHVDIGHNGDTRDMIKEVVGMVRGNGFTPKIKPESYAASYVADRYV